MFNSVEYNRWLAEQKKQEAEKSAQGIPGLSAAMNSAFSSMSRLPGTHPIYSVLASGSDGTPSSADGVYGSNDLSGYDQSQWALEEQWKLDEAERQYNSAEAQKQRDWEKEMSDTAIQRAVADIKAAGLNPWLALNGGSLGAASTPSGASASSSSGSSKVPQNYLVKLLTALVSSASSIVNKLL